MAKYDEDVIADFLVWLEDLLTDGPTADTFPKVRWWHYAGLRLARRKLQEIIDDYLVRDHMERRSAEHIEEVAQRAAAIVLKELKGGSE